MSGSVLEYETLEQAPNGLLLDVDEGEKTMTQKPVRDLKELFKQAAEIAQQVPESMQQAAFNRAVDLLTGATQDREDEEQKLHRVRKTGKPLKPAIEIGDHDSAVDALMVAIDSTAHPEVVAKAKVLDRSLMVLQIALNDHGTDGLTSSEIGKILTEKFRIGTSDAAVRMALGSATSLVNRIPHGNGYVYRIMGPGEEYLRKLQKGEGVLPVVGGKRKNRRKEASRKEAKSIVSSDGKHDVSGQARENTNKKKTEGPRRRPTIGKSSVGPKTAVLELIKSGFFSAGRTGPEVQTHLKNKRGFNFGIAQLRLAMLRLVRDGALDRDENKDGQYEYKQPKA